MSTEPSDVMGEHGGIAPTPQKGERGEARHEKATPLLSFLTVIHRAEGLIIYQFRDRGIVAADWAGRVAADFERVEVHLQGVVHQQATDERVALTENEFDDFSGLHEANRAGQNAQHACFVSRRRQICRRRRGVQASVARPLVVARIDRDLALESENAAIHDGLFQEHARVVDQISRWEIVASIDDNVVFRKNVHDVVGREVVRVRHHLATGVDLFEGLVRRDGFETAQVGRAVQDLALQVGDVDHVGIDNAERPNARRGQIQARRATQSAGADEQHTRVEQFALSAFPHFGNEQMAGEPLHFGLVERAVAVEVQPGGLPRLDVALDVRDIGIAHALQCLCGQRALALVAIDDNRAITVVVHAFDAKFEKPTRHIFRAGDIPSDVVFALAHVNEQRAIGVEFLLGAFRRKPGGVGRCPCDKHVISRAHGVSFRVAGSRCLIFHPILSSILI